MKTLSKRFSQMRSTFGLICLIIAFLATGLYSITHYNVLGNRIGQIFSIHPRLSHHLDEVQRATNEIKGSFILHLANEDEAAENSYRGNIKALQSSREKLEEMLDDLPSDLSEALNPVAAKLRTLEEHTELFFELGNSNNNGDPFVDFFAAQLSPFLVELSDAIREVQKLNYDMLADGGDASLKAVVKGVRLLMLLVLLALLCLLYAAYLYTSKVFRPLRRLSLAVRQLAESTPNGDIPNFSVRELGPFYRPINRMVNPSSTLVV